MIYLDYQATTPVDPAVQDVMLPWLGESFGNPHSPHRMGREAKAAIDIARAKIMALLEPGELIFTSGATEALNLAIKGVFATSPPERKRVVTIVTEHAAVLDTVQSLSGQGADVVALPVGLDGLVDLAAAEQAITSETALVAAMLVNNEIGVIQPIAALSALAKAKGALFLCDAVQGFGRVDIPADACDLIALSAHKIYGPKGIGALWRREGVALSPQMHGGGQEAGIRSGTLSPMLCAGFGKAAALMAEHRVRDDAHVAAMAARLVQGLGEGWTLNGSASQRYQGNLNLRYAGLDVARLMSETRRLCFSAGSACSSGSGRPSHVLRALGLSEKETKSSIRLGLGRFTTLEDIEKAVDMIAMAVRVQQGSIA